MLGLPVVHKSHEATFSQPSVIPRLLNLVTMSNAAITYRPLVPCLVPQVSDVLSVSPPCLDSCALTVATNGGQAAVGHRCGSVTVRRTARSWLLRRDVGTCVDWLVSRSPLQFSATLRQPWLLPTTLPRPYRLASRRLSASLSGVRWRVSMAVSYTHLTLPTKRIV